MVTVPLLARIPSPSRKHTAWTNVPPYLEISVSLEQIGYRQPQNWLPIRKQTHAQLDRLLDGANPDAPRRDLLTLS
jgi:hypothetical protein